MLKNHPWSGRALTLALATLGWGAQAELNTLHGHVPAAVAHLSPVGRLPADRRLDLAIGLPLRDPAGLNQFLHALYDPASTNYHRYLEPTQFTERFGPTTHDYQKVVEFARANGLTVTHTHGNRLLVDVAGRAADIEQAFHFTLRTYHHPTEARDFFAPDGEPSVPAGVPIKDISGLSDFAKPKPMLHRKPAGQAARDAAGSGPGNTYLGLDFRQAYVPGTPLDGTGQTVGLFQLTGYDPNDIFAYEAQAGLPNVHLQNVLIDGTAGLPVTGEEDEACLDIEMAISMAPKLSAVVVFQSLGYGSAWIDIVNTMSASNQIKQFSSSWGFYAAPNQTLEQIFQEMAAQGQSFFQASGDGDAWTSPIWQPAESTNLTVVGGTELVMNGAGTGYQSEAVWNLGDLGSAWGGNGSTNDYWGSGGGISTDVAIPDWQTNVDMTLNLGSLTQRNVPDVAMVADNVYVTHGSGTNGAYGGTSCAAPLWAGFMALVNQQSAGLNRPPAGFINPAIYALGSSTNYAACFHDTTTGNNAWSGSPDRYYAVPGYDLCTGWGTPAGTNLINALAGGLPDSLTITPLAGFTANGAVGGPFAGASQVFYLENSGAEAMEWSLMSTASWLAIPKADGLLAAGGQTAIIVNLADAAKALPAGTYTATVFFTNRFTQAVQPRLFTLQVGQNLVQDGGFESGTFSYWTLTGRTISDGLIFNAVEDILAGFSVVHTGSQGAFLGDWNVAILSQALPTYPGQKYLLSFWLNNPIRGAGEFFEANWNTNGLATNTVYLLPAPPVMAWTNLNFVLSATDTNTTLQFGAANPPNYFGVDDVSVLPVPAPSFSAVAAVSNGVALTWNTLANVGYVVQYKTDLTQPDWSGAGGAIIAPSNALTWVDTNAGSLLTQRFYRVSVSP